MPPPPDGAVISEITIVQNGGNTTTVGVATQFTVKVTAEFGNNFPNAPVTLRLVIVDVMAGGTVVVTQTQMVPKATIPNSEFTFTVPTLGTASSGDICNVYAVLLAAVTANPNSPPLTAIATESFVAY